MKKVFFLLAVMIGTMSMISVPVFAHGGHGRGSSTHSQTAYAVCTVENCTTASLHEHAGTWYYCAEHGTGGCSGGHCRIS